METEFHFHQKFANTKCQRVKVGESFLPVSDDEANEVEHLLAEPKNDHVFGPCLKFEDFSGAFDYGPQTSSGRLDANRKQGREDELRFGDIDQLLDDVDVVEEIHATNGLSSTCEDYLLDIEFAERSTNLNSVSREGSRSGRSISGWRSLGSSGGHNGAIGISGLSAAIIPKSESNSNIREKDVTCELHGAVKKRRRSAALAEESSCRTLVDAENVDKFNNDGSPLRNGMTYENERGYLEAGKYSSCSRERRMRKPTRRYIEEFSSSKSESYKRRRGRLSAAAKKDRRMKVKIRGETQNAPLNALTLVPANEYLSGSSNQSAVRRGRPKKHASILHFQSEDESPYESENDCLTTKRSKKCDRRKHQRMWALSEVIKLVDGIAEYGTGRWTDIKRQLFSSSAYRTPIDLRDKWRNLLRASRIHRLNKRGVEQKQTQAVRPLPKTLLGRVHELAKIHPYPKERSSKVVGAEVDLPMLPSGTKGASSSLVRKKYT